MDYNSLMKLSYADKSDYINAYETRFNNECTTLLDFDISGNKAFFITNQELLMLVTKIAKSDKILKDKTIRLPNLMLIQYTKQILIDEVQQTNDIENVFSTKKQINETIKKIENNKDNGRFNGLIRKYQPFNFNSHISLSVWIYSPVLQR